MSDALEPIYRDLPEDQKFEHIARVSAPHLVHTNLGNWIHVSIVQKENVPDPANLPEGRIQASKEHSLFIYNPELEARLKADPRLKLTEIPFDQLAKPNEETLMRVHSLCRFGDAFGSEQCDCGQQLFAAKRSILQRGYGIIFYAEQEGRNASLTAKAAFYGLIDERGMPTSQTFEAVGFHDNDLRTYPIAVEAVQLLGLRRIEMMSNNPKKIKPFKDAGIEIQSSRLQVPASAHNGDYLEDKRDSMGHILAENLGSDLGNPHVEVAQGLKDIAGKARRRHVGIIKQVFNLEALARQVGKALRATIRVSADGKAEIVVEDDTSAFDPHTASDHDQPSQGLD